MAQNNTSNTVPWVRAPPFIIISVLYYTDFNLCTMYVLNKYSLLNFVVPILSETWQQNCAVVAFHKTKYAPVHFEN